MAEERVRVLLVDDEESLRVPLKKFLESNFGYQVDAIASGIEALQQVEEASGRYDVVLIDDLLTPTPGEEARPIGIEVMRKIKQHYPETEAIVFTGWSGLPDWDKERAMKALQAGAFRYLEKPFDNDVLARLIHTAAQQVRLREIGRAILSEKDLDQVLERITSAACSLAMAAEAAIALLVQATGRIAVHAQAGPGEQVWRKHFKNWKSSEEIIRTGQIVYVPDTAKHDPQVDEKVINAGIRSFVGLPIPGEGGNLGVLYVYSRQPKHFDDGSTVAVLQTMAAQAGLALANARAFQQIQAHASYMEALVRTGQGLTHTTEVQQQLNLAWDFVREQLKASTFFVALYDKRADLLRFPLVYDEGQSVSVSDVVLGDDPQQWGLAGYAVKRGKEKYWPTEEDKLRECRNLGIKPKRVGKSCQSCFLLPLKIGNEVIGAMSVQSYEQHAFSPIVLDACRALGSQLSVALENARLLTQMQRTREAAQVIARVTLQEKLDQTLKTIAKHTQQVLRSDAVNIYTYDEATGTLGDEWTVEIRDPRRLDSARPPRDVRSDSAIWSILNLPGPKYYHLAEDHVAADSLLGGRFVRDEDIQAAIGIQLRGRGHKTGVMFVNFRSAHRFTSDEIATIQLFADQAAVAIRNARQYAEIVHDAGLRKGLLQAGREIMALQRPEAVLQNVVNLMQKVLACDVVTLYPYDQDREEISFPAYVAGELRDRKSLDELGYVSKDSVVGKLLASGEPHFADDAPKDLMMSAGGFVQREEIKSSAGIPLKFGDRVIGIVFVNYRTFHPFPTQEQEALLLFATQTAAAIRNAQQFEQINRKTAGLQVLYEAGRALSGTLALDDILHHIVEQAWHLTGRYGKQARFSLLALREGRWLRVQTAYPPECLPGLQKRVGNIDLEGGERIGVTGRAVKTGKAQRVEDVAQDPDYIPYDPETRSELAVPIKLGDEVFGVINVEHPDRSAFDEEDQHNLDLLAAQAALAIRNARQYEELRRAKSLVGSHAALAWMGMANTVWRHAIEQHAVTIREQSQLLRMEMRKPSPCLIYIQEKLDTIERLANQILKKRIAPPLSREEGVEPVALNDLVGERARQLWQNDPYKKATLRLTLQLPGSATVQASPEWLRRAFDILVDNAVEAVAGREVREITIGTRPARDGVEIFVSDTGPGIPEEIRAKIGLKAIEKPEDARGMGMGLRMAQVIAQAYGGELRVVSTGSNGTTMAIWLPLAV